MKKLRDLDKKTVKGIIGVCSTKWEQQGQLFFLRHVEDMLDIAYKKGQESRKTVTEEENVR